MCKKKSDAFGANCSICLRRPRRQNAQLFSGATAPSGDRCSAIVELVGEMSAQRVPLERQALVALLDAALQDDGSTSNPNPNPSPNPDPNPDPNH